MMEGTNGMKKMFRCADILGHIYAIELITLEKTRDDKIASILELSESFERMYFCSKPKVADPLSPSPFHNLTAFWTCDIYKAKLWKNRSECYSFLLKLTSSSPLDVSLRVVRVKNPHRLKLLQSHLELNRPR